MVVIIVLVASVFLRIIQVHDETDFFTKVVVETGFSFFKHPGAVGIEDRHVRVRADTQRAFVQTEQPGRGVRTWLFTPVVTGRLTVPPLG